MGIQPLDPPALSRTRQTSGNTCESRCRPEDDIPVSRFISRMPRDIDIGASGIPYSASGLWHPASIHRASRPHGLFHNFCWQACGHPEHPPSNTLIRRHFPETVRNAASRLKSVRRAPHGRRPPPNRPAASPRRQSSTTHFRRSSFPQFLCANLWISRAAARQAIDPSELFAILVPAARRLAQASAMRSSARAARASAYTGACRHRRTCPCRRRAARRRQSG
ncbi:amylo-alpha-1,6-glucosidase domain protein [Burkholderia pseudomallei MSHR5613]|nr:amylo-alpha-1,6-glucosidase domain protein [Burkholderia pseudomallei MSHR5613]